MGKPLYFIFALALLSSSCATNYKLANVSRSRILIDSRYEKPEDSMAATFIGPYKQKVDSIMSPVVGYAARYMWAEKPESNLSNLLSDILIWAGKFYNEKPEVGVYNMGGIRAALAEGSVTYGNILDIAPFENKICFFNLTGRQLMTLFNQIAKQKGDGVSHGVELLITKDGKLLSARLNGKEIDEKRTYRIASIDYLAQGNDGLYALKEHTDLKSPQESQNNMRYIIASYFKEKMKAGEVVDAKVEGRIIMQ